MMEECMKTIIKSHKALSLHFAFITLFALYMGSPLAALPALLLMIYYFVMALLSVQRAVSGQTRRARENREKLHQELMDAHKLALSKLPGAAPDEVESIFSLLIEGARLSGKDDPWSITRARAIVGQVYARLRP